MLSKFLLSCTALGVVTTAAALAHADTFGSGEDLSVTISGKYRFNVGLVDQDESSGFSRGYSFKVDDAELHIKASNTADNGVNYGVTIELQTNTDDTENADEVWAFVSGDFGRIELGDQDDVTDRMHLEGDSVLVGRAGPDGDVEDLFQFGSGGAIDETGNDATSDATKISYFTPRVSGFQLGVSHTPDTGADGASFAETDNDGNYEKVWGLGANYAGEFNGFTFGASATYEIGDSEDNNGGETEGNLETISVGGILEYGGYSFGIGYVDFQEKGQKQSNIARGEDSGSYWNAGVAYRHDPWGVSASYFASQKGQPFDKGGDTTVDIISLDGEYRVAPGWLVSLSANYVEANNINATSTPAGNDGTVVIFSNTFNF
jgi:outer membrane protein OmpU